MNSSNAFLCFFMMSGPLHVMSVRGEEDSYFMCWSDIHYVLCVSEHHDLYDMHFEIYFVGRLAKLFCKSKYN
jgi:hypothetical protein